MRPVPLGLIGPRAGKILARNPRGVVLSSHAAGLYCRFDDGGIILMHGVEHGLIPFGLGCKTPPPSGWKGYAPGTAVLHDAKRETVSLNDTEYSYSDAKTPAPLLPCLPPETVTAERLRAGIEASIPLLGKDGIAARYLAKRASLCGTLPRTAPFEDMWEEALWEPLHNLMAYRSNEGRRIPDAVVAALIGLGPGLTPLGDDILCGLLAGGHSCKAFFPDAAVTRFVARLAPAVQRLSPGATTSQSAAFLQSAADGELFGMLDAALASLFTHNAVAMHKAFSATLDIGHTSGSGVLLGLLLAAESGTH